MAPSSKARSDAGIFTPAPVNSGVSQPGAGVARVFEVERGLGDGKRTEGVNHDRELFGLFLADRRFGAAWLRAMRDAVGMQGEGAKADSLAAHELVVGVEEDFV